LDVNYYRFFKVLPTATSMFSKQYQLLPRTNALSDWFKYLDLDVDRFWYIPRLYSGYPLHVLTAGQSKLFRQISCIHGSIG